MSREAHREDEVVLEIVDALARGDAPSAGSTLERETTELWALLPYELEPAPPRPEVWEEIRGRLASSRVVPFPERRQAAPPPPASARRGGWGTSAMAAALAVCLLGLGYLLAKTEQQQTAIAELAARLAAADDRLAETSRARAQLDMITRVAQHVYPMHSTPTGSQRRPITGKVFVCGQHQQWYLNVQGLEAPPPGYDYCLWFETAAGMVLGGTMTVRDGVAELSAPSMPPGTKGFAVTLEKTGSHREKPQGDVLLLGEESISL
ncbi:MAG TPA: anti-sigma factor [Thermoanaerobaculia bacterium]|jgi:hypothetical protein